MAVLTICNLVSFVCVPMQTLSLLCVLLCRSVWSMHIALYNEEGNLCEGRKLGSGKGGITKKLKVLQILNSQGCLHEKELELLENHLHQQKIMDNFVQRSAARCI